MRSTFGGLNTAVRGINSSQLSLDTTGHNITNANTDGYSRQRVNTATTRSQTVYGFYGACQLGTGVDTMSITRARDVFADKQYWKESTNMQYASAKQASYDKIEAIFDDSEEQGFQNNLNKFWKSWKTLSTSASDHPTRVVVRDTGKKLTESMQMYAKQLQDLVADNSSQIELKVNSVNEMTRQIYELNKQVFKLETTGGYANDLRDSRDLLVDKLSEMVNVSVNEMPNGTYTISSDGNILVSNDSYLELDTVRSVDKEYGVQKVDIIIKKTGTVFSPSNGALKGHQDSVTEAKNYLDELATMSKYLLTAFNEQHRAGYGIQDTTNINFFGTDGTPNADGSGSITYTFDTATGDLIKSDAVTGTQTRLTTMQAILEMQVNERFDETNGTELIAAKSKPSPDENSGSGNNAVKLGDLLHINSSSAVLGNVTLTAYYTGIIGKLGLDSEAVDNNVTNQENILTQISNWRNSVSGVNWDEELTDMIRFQTAYKSCSRCLTAMDEMLDKLINGTGIVGR